MLIKAFAEGDPAAARLILSRHIGPVLALALRMLKDRNEAEDVAQETFLSAWRAASSWEPGRAQFSTWLHRIAANKCLDRLRKRKPEPIPDGFDAVSTAPNPEEDLINEELGDRVERAIHSLPDRQRAALSLSLHRQLSNPEIAEIMGASVEAIESLLARGRRTLKQQLRPDWQSMMGEVDVKMNEKERIGK